MPYRIHDNNDYPVSIAFDGKQAALADAKKRYANDLTTPKSPLFLYKWDSDLQDWRSKGKINHMTGRLISQ